jgi:hypothetical protein
VSDTVLHLSGNREAKEPPNQTTIGHALVRECTCSCQVTHKQKGSLHLSGNAHAFVREHTSKTVLYIGCLRAMECPLRGAGGVPGSSSRIQAGTSSPSLTTPLNVHKSFKTPADQKAVSSTLPILCKEAIPIACCSYSISAMCTND